jgi:hypothetical protein
MENMWRIASLLMFVLFPMLPAAAQVDAKITPPKSFSALTSATTTPW